MIHWLFIYRVIYLYMKILLRLYLVVHQVFLIYIASLTTYETTRRKTNK